jgi:hypothetical protein
MFYVRGAQGARRLYTRAKTGKLGPSRASNKWRNTSEGAWSRNRGHTDGNQLRPHIEAIYHFSHAQGGIAYSHLAAAGYFAPRWWEYGRRSPERVTRVREKEVGLSGAYNTSATRLQAACILVAVHLHALWSFAEASVTIALKSRRRDVA